MESEAKISSEQKFSDDETYNGEDTSSPEESDIDKTYYREKEAIPYMEYDLWIRAAAEGDIKTIQTYIYRDYDVNTQYDMSVLLFNATELASGYNALIAASEYNQEDIVKLLLNNGANVNLTSEHGITPLFVASVNGHENIVKLMLKNGANANFANNRGITPLMEASANGHKNIVELLLNNGADVRAKSNNGLTALDLAVANKHKKIEELLKKEGAKTTDFQNQWRMNKDSNTPRTIPITTARANDLITSGSQSVFTTAKVVASGIATATAAAVASSASPILLRKYKKKTNPK